MPREAFIKPNMHTSDKSAPPCFKLAVRQLRRDWQAGALTVLIASLILSIATVTSISLFTSRIHNTIFSEASNFLAGDVRISGSMAIPLKWIEKANALNLDTAQYVTFSSMVFSEQEMILSQVKAVDSHYPLKGELTAATVPYAEGKIMPRGPLPGTVWLAPRLFDALGMSPGDTLFIGDAEFTATLAVAKEPDSGQSFFGVSPRTMMHWRDVEKTQVIQPGARIDYALLLSGTPSSLSEFEQWLTPQIGHHHKWQWAHNSNRSVGDALKRATQFLMLSGSLTVILGGVAIALASRRYARRHIKTVALLKTLGATPKDVISIFMIVLSVLGLITLAIGTLFGWLFHHAILAAISELIATQLAKAQLSAYGIGALTGILALLAFAVPPIIALRNVMPATALNQRLELDQSHIGQNLLGLSAIFILVLSYSQNISLTLYLILGAGLCAAGVFILSWASIKSSQYLTQHLNHTWRLGLQNFQRHRQTNAVQMMIFSILFLLVTTLIGARTHLISQWQNQIPDNAANHFAFNIYPEERSAIEDFFSNRGISHSPFYPMTRGRLTEVNGVAVNTLLEQAPNTRMNYKREVNLTSASKLAADNEIVAGKWWDQLVLSSEVSARRISMEQDYAQGLGIQVGDTLTFSIAGQIVLTEVASLRSVQWDSMNPNFFVIFEQPLDEEFGANWLTSFYLSANEKAFIAALSRQYPTISIIELDQTLNQVKNIISKVSAAVEFIMLLVLAAGLLVLITSIQATLDTRLKESAILRTIGASQALIRKTLFVEFAALGFMAGLLATLGTEVILYLLQSQVFNLPYRPFYILWLVLPLISTILLAVTGWLSTRSVITTSPVDVLRRLS